MINPKFIKEISQPHWLILYLYFFLVLINSIFCYFNQESFSNLNTFGDSVYFSIVTITTLGYGDICPIDGFGKFMVSMSSVAGVILLGFFLISVSSQVEKDREQKRLNTIKLSFKEQYKIWRKYTTFTLCSVAQLTYDDRLNDMQEFRNFFKKDENLNWNKVADSLLNNNFYIRELFGELELLERNIGRFIMQVSIEDEEVMNTLNRYSSKLYKMRQSNLEDSDELKSFMRELWELMTFWSLISGYSEKDPLLIAIEKI